MSFHINIVDQVIHIQFSGSVDGLEIMQIIGDDGFIPQLQTFQKVIFDYGQTEDVDMSMEETKSFATIGKINANFIDNLHMVIIASGPEGKERAEFYRQNVGSPNWKIDIVDSPAVAFALLTSSQL